MVFFMIMPLIFGAFGNFLLPTQLGVHDVAFPRLNSAAFWFLPGGLIMLCQLVCIDRRYQRMNCFNIRELQGILKRRFFTDLVNTNDFRTLLDESMVGLRFKVSDQHAFTPNTPLFYNYGLTLDQNTKVGYLSTSAETLYSSSTITPTSVMFNGVLMGRELLAAHSCASYTHTFVSNLARILFELPTLLFSTSHPYSLLSFTFSFNHLNSLLSANLPNSSISALITQLPPSFDYSESNKPVTTKPSIFTADSVPSIGAATTAESSFSEKSDFRFTRFTNSLIQYDYKCGNYIGT
jgi:hypothetical protein